MHFKSVFLLSLLGVASCKPMLRNESSPEILKGIMVGMKELLVEADKVIGNYNGAEQNDDIKALALKIDDEIETDITKVTGMDPIESDMDLITLVPQFEGLGNNLEKTVKTLKSKKPQFEAGEMIPFLLAESDKKREEALRFGKITIDKMPPEIKMYESRMVKVINDSFDEFNAYMKTPSNEKGSQSKAEEAGAESD